MLVRDYLRRALYDGQGYFVRESPIIYKEGRIVNFHGLGGRTEWMRLQNEMFSTPGESGGGEWLTQSELFAPYFSRTLVEFVVRLFKERNHSKLNIVEVGGGSGSNALHFLDTLKERYPALYSKTCYSICEISSTLGHIQLSRLSGRHPDVARVLNQDFLNWPDRVDDPTFIMAIEVLDNLPHDKVTFKGPASNLREGFNLNNKSLWDEILVESTGVEVAQQVQDPLIVRALELFHGPNKKMSNEQKNDKSLSIMERFSSKFKQTMAQWSRISAERNAKSMFIPTGALQLLQTARDKFPTHTLLAADFAFLPFGDVRMTSKNLKVPGSLFGCKNAPIVSGMDVGTGKRKDFPSYILPPKQKCDIFFQTDFESLARAYQVETGGSATIQSSPKFLTQYVKEEDKAQTTTQSGYNPKLEDFENVSFMIAQKM